MYVKPQERRGVSGYLKLKTGGQVVMWLPPPLPGDAFYSAEIWRGGGAIAPLPVTPLERISRFLLSLVLAPISCSYFKHENMQLYRSL